MGAGPYPEEPGLEQGIHGVASEMSAGQQGPNEREEPFCTKNILVCHSLSHLFNETYGPEKEPDMQRAVHAKGM